MKKQRNEEEVRFFIGDKIFIEGLWSECFLFVEQDQGNSIMGSIWSPEIGGIVDSHVVYPKRLNWKPWKGQINLQPPQSKRRCNPR